MSKDLTLILTLRDRFLYTKRWLEWMNSQRCPFPILVADGSSNDAAEVLLKTRRYEHLDIRYLRYPPDRTKTCWFKKLAGAAAEVKTPWAALADNDDFPLINSLVSAVDEAKRSDAVCIARPQYRVRINEQATEVDAHLIPHGTKVRVTRIPYASSLQKLAGTKPEERLEVVTKTFPSSYIWYGLHRAENLARMHASIVDMNFTQVMFQEWYFLYSTVLSGKVQATNAHPFLVRQEQTSQGAVSLYDSERLDRIFLDPDWSRNFTTMTNRLQTEQAASGSGLAEADFHRQFREWFSIHLLQFNDGRLLRMRLAKYRALVALGSHVLSWMKGKSPLFFKYEKLSGAGRDSELHALDQFLHTYNPGD